MENKKNSDLEVIQFIIKKGGLLFGNFRLKSNRISPYFFNLANIVMDGEGLVSISRVFANFIHDYIGLDSFDLIFGPAYKGISLSAAICMQLYNLYNVNKRWGYDRKEIKKYGDKKEKWLIGKFMDNDQILIVDDVLTTGLTKINIIEKIKKNSDVNNLEFVGILVLLDRQEKMENNISAEKYLENSGLKCYSILKIKEIYDILYNKTIENKIVINSEKYKQFKNYIKKYGS